MASTYRNGYGSFSHKTSRSARAHRMAWIFAVGPVPRGAVVCHRCDNPSCVNPAHLFLGSQADNMRDKIAKGRQLRGEGIGTSRLTEQQVSEIRARHGAYNIDGESCRKLAAEFGVSDKAIWHAVKGNTWRHVVLR